MAKITTPAPSHPHVDEGAELMKEFDELHKKMYNFILTLRQGLENGEYKLLPIMVDLGFLCREVSDKANDSRKEFKAQSELFGSKIAFEFTQRNLSGEHVPDPIRGNLANGSPDLEMQVGIPRKGTEEYTTFMSHFGIPPETTNLGVIDPDWKGVAKYVTDQLRQGKNPPPGTGKKYPRYYTTYTRRKNRVDEE